MFFYFTFVAFGRNRLIIMRGKGRGYWIYTCEELMKESSAEKEGQFFYLVLKAVKARFSTKYL